MRRRTLIVILGVVSIFPQETGFTAEDELCGPLRRFIESVKPDETRVLKFHTTWGSNFKDSDEWAMRAKRCDHDGYEPAKAVCQYFMEYGATEFSGSNAIEAVECLSAKTRFGPLRLHALSLSLTYGTENRGGVTARRGA